MLLNASLNNWTWAVLLLLICCEHYQELIDILDAKNSRSSKRMIDFCTSHPAIDPLQPPMMETATVTKKTWEEGSLHSGCGTLLCFAETKSLAPEEGLKQTAEHPQEEDVEQLPFSWFLWFAELGRRISWNREDKILRLLWLCKQPAACLPSSQVGAQWEWLHHTHHALHNRICHCLEKYIQSLFPL